MTTLITAAKETTLQHARTKFFLNVSCKIKLQRQNSTGNDTFYPFNPIKLTGIVQRHDTQKSAKEEVADG